MNDLCKRMTIALAVIIFAAALPLDIMAQKKNNNTDHEKVIKKVDGFDYELLPGLAEVLSIKIIKVADSSALNYDEYEVLFKFIPMEGDELLEILKDKTLEFKLCYQSSQVRIGPAYIHKMKLRVGRQYAMNLFQTKSKGVNMRRYFYESKALENNLFQAYENIIDGFSLRLSFSDLGTADSTVIDVDKDTLSKVEQRALVDAELKHDKFIRSQFTQAALDYLKDHKSLLEEYESALAVLCNMEEEKLRQKKLEEQLKQEKAAQLEAKKALMIDPNAVGVFKKNKIVRGCSYEVLPGLAEVTSIKLKKKAQASRWNYDEHEVLFKFIPMEGHDLLEELKETELEFVLYNRGDKIPVGPMYIKEKNVRVGTRYAMTFYQKEDATACTDQYTYESKGLDNDLFEAFPPKPYFSALKAKMDSIEQLEKKALAIAEWKADSSRIENAAQDSLMLEKKATANNSNQVLTYEEALDNVEKAKVERKKWRIICNQAIRDARKKVRIAKKNKKNIATKKENKIKIGAPKVLESTEASNSITVANVTPTTTKETPTSSSYLTRAAALKNARKKARLARKAARKANSTPREQTNQK